MQPLQDRVAVVTHSSHDPGLAIRTALLKAGARAVSTDEGENSSYTAPATLVQRAVSQFGRVDIMVNLHVIPPSAPVETMPLTIFKDGVTANLTQIYFGCQFAAEQMRQQSPTGGCIINISSVGGVVALPGHAAFCAAMAGVNAVTKVLATEWQAYGIRVVGVGVGLRRELVESLALRPTLPDGTTPSHRRVPEYTVTTPEEVADAVVYLASDAARHVTGTTLYVDGGWLADGYWE